MKILALFTKYWSPGFVKSRLAADIGPSLAAEVYRCFVMHLSEELKSSADERYFYVSPDHDVEKEFFQSATAWKIRGQGKGDLGQRLIRSCNSLSVEDRVVIIGGDCPTVTRCEIDSAFSTLNRVSVAVGPSTDGGYYLIGLRGPWQTAYVQLFENIDWGSERVLNQTISRLLESHIDHELLAPHSDVDTLNDLIELEKYLQRSANNRLLQSLSHVMKSL